MRRTDQRRAAVVALYQGDVTGRPAPDLVERSASAFTHELVEGVERHREEIDEQIADHAEGWTLDRIAPVERNILRVALHELLHRSDVPDEVAIDEAIEAAGAAELVERCAERAAQVGAELDRRGREVEGGPSAEGQERLL